MTPFSLQLFFRALNRDLTRFGVRTKIGVFNDGLTFLARYINGNFRDKIRQLGIDKVLGDNNR